jgi:hypothetical protein
MLSKRNKNYINKRSIKNKHFGGVTLMKGKYAFFVNKNKYINLFGNIEKDKNAPSIKDIEKNFNLDGFYIENNTRNLYRIGYYNLSYSEQAKFHGVGKLELETTINLDDEDQLEKILISKFNYDRIIPIDPKRFHHIYKDGKTPTVDDSFLCVIININHLASNKYINFIYKDIKIIQEKDPREQKIEREFKKIKSLPTNERNEALLRYNVREKSRRARLDANDKIRYIKDENPDIIREKKKIINNELNAQLKKIKKTQLAVLNRNRKQSSLESEDQEKQLSVQSHSDNDSSVESPDIQTKV